MGVFHRVADGVRAPDPDDGVERWTADRSGIPAARVDDAIVLKGTDVAGVLEAGAGSARWARTPGHGEATLATDTQDAYYGHFEGEDSATVAAYDLVSGVEAWALPLHGPNGFPVVTGGRVFVASGARNDWWLTRVASETGERRWTRPGVILNAADAHLLATVRHMRHAVEVFEPSTGNRRWAQEFDVHVDRYTPDVWLSDSSVIFAGRRDVCAVARSDGERRWTLKPEGLVEEIHTVGRRTYVQTRKRVYGFEE